MTETETAETQHTNAPNDPQAGVTYSCSRGLPRFLASINASLAFSSYQSGKLYLVGSTTRGGLHVHERFFQKAMGIATAPGKLVLASLFQIIRFENDLKPGEFINDVHDACFVPRLCHVTGVLDAHDVGITADGGVVFVNTRFNCLAKRFSRPQFHGRVEASLHLEASSSEDRCHLNGLAMETAGRRYVTAVSRSDTIDGWRDRRADGGVVIDVRTQQDRLRRPVDAAFAAAGTASCGCSIPAPASWAMV